MLNNFFNIAGVAYVNLGNGGAYLPRGSAFTHIEDRAAQYSDGIYEVIQISNEKMIDGEGHLNRLKRSLSEMQIDMPVSIPALRVIIKELQRHNNYELSNLYIQISRGIAKRDHLFPKTAKPTLIMTLTAAKRQSAKETEEGVSVITMPDIRWGRRDIKTISLLPNVLAKQEAYKKGVKEAWLYKPNKEVTEGSSTNAYIVDKSGVLITHPATNEILGGITRDTVIRLAKKAGIKVVEKAFTIDEAKKAKEAFLTSTTMRVTPIVKIDEKFVGNGKPGETTAKLLKLYNDYVEKQTS